MRMNQGMAILYSEVDGEEVVAIYKEFPSSADAERYIVALLGTELNGEMILWGRLYENIDDVWTFTGSEFEA